MGISMSLSTSIFESIGSQRTPTETITYLDQLYKVNGTSPTPGLP